MVSKRGPTLLASLVLHCFLCIRGSHCSYTLLQFHPLFFGMWRRCFLGEIYIYSRNLTFCWKYKQHKVNTAEMLNWPSQVRHWFATELVNKIQNAAHLKINVLLKRLVKIAQDWGGFLNIFGNTNGTQLIFDMVIHPPCDIHMIFSKNIFCEKISVVGTMCAIWVHILCLIIHFWEAQIWIFTTAKYHFSMYNANAKVWWKSVYENVGQFFMRFMWKKSKILAK